MMKRIHILLSILFLAGGYLLFMIFGFEENRIIVRNENKPALKYIARKANSFIYDEATKHNPAGDVLPDNLDNSIKDKIKESLE